MHIILYQGGAHGDLVSSLIDSNDYIVGTDRIIALPDRQIFANLSNDPFRSNEAQSKREMEFAQIDSQIEILQSKYIAVASHLFYYFLNRNHKFILIDSSASGITERCVRRAERLSKSQHLYSDTIIKKIRMDIKLVKQKTDMVINYNDIIEGRLLTTLKQWIDTPLNENIYNKFMRRILPNNINNYDFW
jgi:hypothetical protein